VAVGEVGKDKTAGGGLVFFEIGHFVCCLGSKRGREMTCFSTHLFCISLWARSQKFGNHLLQVKCLLFAHNNLRTDQFDTPN
jgi:hypothetical protein